MKRNSEAVRLLKERLKKMDAITGEPEDITEPEQQHTHDIGTDRHAEPSIATATDDDGDETDNIDARIDEDKSIEERLDEEQILDERVITAEAIEQTDMNIIDESVDEAEVMAEYDRIDEQDVVDDAESIDEPVDEPIAHDEGTEDEPTRTEDDDMMVALDDHELDALSYHMDEDMLSDTVTQHEDMGDTEDSDDMAYVLDDAEDAVEDAEDDEYEDDDEDDYDDDTEHEHEDDYEDDDEQAHSIGWVKMFILVFLLIAIFVAIGYAILTYMAPQNMAPANTPPNTGIIISYIMHNTII